MSIHNITLLYKKHEVSVEYIYHSAENLGCLEGARPHLSIRKVSNTPPELDMCKLQVLVENYHDENKFKMREQA